jgi:hypothetical protein
MVHHCGNRKINPHLVIVKRPHQSYCNKRARMDAHIIGLSSGMLFKSSDLAKQFFMGSGEIGGILRGRDDIKRIDKQGMWVKL